MRIVTFLIQDTPVHSGGGPARTFPALEFVLRRGAIVPQSQSEMVSWLCSRFGLAREPDWPVAPLLARAAGFASVYPVWLCADPVHINMDSVRPTVVAAPALSMCETESRDMVVSLDSHFRDRGLRLFALDRNRWLVNTMLSARINTQSLPRMADIVQPVLASGADAARWNAFLTEAQMLLHMHPANMARLAGGKPAVNSLHLWGSGTEPRPQAVDALVASDDPLTLALAAASSATSVATASEMLDRMWSRADSSALVVRQPAGEAAAAANALLAVDHDWLAPALDALRARRIDRLDVVVPQAQELVGRSVGHTAFARFWMALQPLARHLAKAQRQ